MYSIGSVWIAAGSIPLLGLSKLRSRTRMPLKRTDLEIMIKPMVIYIYTPYYGDKNIYIYTYIHSHTYSSTWAE